MVHQHRQRIFHLFQLRAFGNLIAVSVDNRNDWSLRHQHACNLHAGVKNTAWIAAQVKHQRLHALLLQLLILLCKIRAGIFVEHCNADIANLRIRQKLSADRRILDFLTHYANLAQAPLLILQLQLDLGPLFAADFVSHLLHIHLTRRLAVNTGDDIAALDTGLRTGIILQRRNNHIVIAALAKHNANAAKAAVGHLAQLLIILMIQIHGIRVAHGLHHALNRAVEQLVRRHLAVIIALQQVHRAQKAHRVSRAAHYFMQQHQLCAQHSYNCQKNNSQTAGYYL